MAATTDYDAPRRSTIEDAEMESLDAIKTVRADAHSPDLDLDERLIVSVIGFLSMVGGVALIIRRLRT